MSELKIEIDDQLRDLARQAARIVAVSSNTESYEVVILEAIGQAVGLYQRAMPKPLTPERVDELVEEEIWYDGGYNWDTPEELARAIGCGIKQELGGSEMLCINCGGQDVQDLLLSARKICTCRDADKTPPLINKCIPTADELNYGRDSALLIRSSYRPRRMVCKYASVVFESVCRRMR